VLLANVLEMKDGHGGWKAADTALWREHLRAATMVGRAAARVAVELGYRIEADPGPSGRLGHWRIAGVPGEVMELHSKRAAQIEAECQRRGEASYRARGVAARTTRRAKGHGAEDELVSRWRAELDEAGRPVESGPDNCATATNTQIGTRGRPSCDQGPVPVAYCGIMCPSKKLFCQGGKVQSGG
jgi:hypothetical protein